MKGKQDGGRSSPIQERKGEVRFGEAPRFKRGTRGLQS